MSYEDCISLTLSQKRLAVLESEAFRLAGHPFPLSSPAQVSQVLYHHLRLPQPGPGHTMPTPTRSALMVKHTHEHYAQPDMHN